MIPDSIGDGALRGRVAVITGTSPNIGGTLAAGLAGAGATVVCADLKPENAAAAAETIVKAGGNALDLAFDVTDADAVQAAVDTTVDRFGRIDTLVNNAVMFRSGSIIDMPVEKFRRQLDIIVGGGFLMTQAVARAMIAAEGGGSIVNVLSTAAWQGQAGNIGYATAKSGMINFTRSTAMELAPYGIRVNSFTPTATVPDDATMAKKFESLIQDAADAGVMDFRGLSPWDRLPTPTDYVAAVVFLASDHAAMMTGSDLRVDGGALAKYWPQIPERRDLGGST